MMPKSRSRSSKLTLADVPEEILERILALVLVQSPEPSPRPSWHPYAYQTQTQAPTHPTVISPLLVCRAWLRIATPIHYRHPVLRTPRHVELLLRALVHTPALAPCVRSLHVHATSPRLRELVPLCPNLTTLDVTVDNADSGASAPASTPAPAPGHGHGAPAPTPAGAAGEAPRDRGVIDFCDAFTKTRSIRHLVIRKNAYLTQPNAIYIFEQLAHAVTRWHKLETVNVAFRLSPSPAATALVRALAAAPRLHTLCTQLPTVWNVTLLEIAQNPALTRIVLAPAPELAGAHLFLAEAKKHPRLMDLFRAGAPPPSSSSSASSPNFASYPHPYSHSTVQAHARYAPGTVFRSRAPSTPAPMPASVPMPVATWGYEREGPLPACPPARRPGGPGPAGTIVGPSASAYGSAYAYGPGPVPSHPHQHSQQYQQQYASAPQPHSQLQPHSQHSYHHQPQAQANSGYPAQYYVYGANHHQAHVSHHPHQHQHHAAAATTAAVVVVPQAPYVGMGVGMGMGGQAPRRGAPGTRRMTAS